MESFNSSRANRRFAIGGGMAAAAGLVVHRQTRGRVLTQRGIAGGGVVQLAQGTASFSLFASRFILPDAEEVIAGDIRWVDATTGASLASTGISDYRDVESETGETRHIEGTMSVRGEGSYPFVMEAIAIGPPGSGQDFITFGVGDGVTTLGSATPAAGLGFSYAASGLVTAGDVNIVVIELDLDTGLAVPATPVS